jgi:hypothetical protein
MPKFSHGIACLFDSHLRNTWYGQGQFGLSKALNASARMKKHDSSGKGNGLAGQIQLF